MRYSWPGNVRELRNVIERIVIMNPTTTRFDAKHLPPLVYRDGSRRTWRWIAAVLGGFIALLGVLRFEFLAAVGYGGDLAALVGSQL